MTTRELYRNVLIELNKEESSALYVEDFLYYANKAVNYYVNMRYNLYDVSQQLSDDLRVLRVGPEVVHIKSDAELATCKDTCDMEEYYCLSGCGSAGLPASECNTICAGYKGTCYSKCTDNLLELRFPYRHLLNCIVTTKLNSYSLTCDQQVNTEREYAAKRYTSDRKASILNNAYLEPRFYRPYYDIIGNGLHIHVGDDTKDDFTVMSVTVEYLRNPQELLLPVGNLEMTNDYTMTLEFPDYVCLEIVNTTVALILEQGSDPRLGTNPQVNQSIGPFGGEK